MASDGISHKAKNGKCRICHRYRNTGKHLKAVGEVHHGYATGHIWECIDTSDCDKVANEKLQSNISGVVKANIQTALKVGRFKKYTFIS